jgi:hypothetical protein
MPRSSLAPALRERLLKQLAHPLFEKERWKPEGFKRGRTALGREVLLATFSYPSPWGFELEPGIGQMGRARAYVALEPRTGKVHGSLTVVDTGIHASLHFPGGEFTVRPEGKGIATLLVAHALESARGWKLPVVMHDVYSPRLSAILSRLGARRRFGQRMEFSPQALEKGDHRAFLLQPLGRKRR